jgi:Arc/MetJ-type ribon-helix-helix transcriptional regulator
MGYQVRAAVSRNQLNVRASDELAKLIDKKRVQLSTQLGVIPSRSDVVRFALESYLEVRLSDIDSDGRKAPASRKRTA